MPKTHIQLLLHLKYPICGIWLGFPHIYTHMQNYVTAEADTFPFPVAEILKEINQILHTFLDKSNTVELMCFGVMSL